MSTAQLVELLSATISGNVQLMKEADAGLSRLSTNGNMCIEFLKLISDKSLNPGVKQAAAIYFKNLIRKRWELSEAHGGVPPNERQLIKQHILSIYTDCERMSQLQLKEAILLICLADFPHEWENLFPLLETQWQTATPSSLAAIMSVVETITSRYESQFKSNDILLELKDNVLPYLTVGSPSSSIKFLDILQSSASFLLSHEQTTSPALRTDLSHHLSILISQISAITNIHHIDLPEYFEAHLQQHFSLFIKLLQCNGSPHILSSPFTPLPQGEEREEDPLFAQYLSLKEAIIDLWTIYVNRFQEEVAPFVHALFQAVQTTLVPALLHDSQSEALISKSLKFLSFVLTSKWHDGPSFINEALINQILQSVLFPILPLSDSDVELFHYNAPEFVKRELDTASSGANLFSKRYMALDLIKSLYNYYGESVNDVCIAYVGSLLQRSETGAANSERERETAISLIISLSIRSQTRSQGVMEVNAKIPIFDVLKNLVLPVLLSAEDTVPILRASCIKFISIFRNQFSLSEVFEMIQILMKNIKASPSPVVQTFAFFAFEKLLNSSKIPEASNEQLLSLLTPFFEPLEALVLKSTQTTQSGYSNELIRLLYKIYTLLYQERQIGSNDTLLKSLSLYCAVVNGTLEALVPSVTYIHYTFECIGILSERLLSQEKREEIIERTILPLLIKIIQKMEHEYVPYAIQIMTLLMAKAEKWTANQDTLKSLFLNLLNIELWKSNKSNVMPLIILLCEFLKKCSPTSSGASSFYTQLVQENLLSLMERFKYCLVIKSLQTQAFLLLEHILLHVPREVLRPILQSLYVELLSSMKTQQQNGVLKQCVCVILAIVIANFQVKEDFVDVLNGINKDNLAANIANKVILPNVNVGRNEKRALFVTCCVKILQQQELHQGWDTVRVVLTLLAGMSVEMSKKEEEKMKKEVEGEEREERGEKGEKEEGEMFEMSFSRLAVVRNLQKANVEKLTPVTDVTAYLRQNKDFIHQAYQFYLQNYNANPALHTDKTANEKITQFAQLVHNL